MNEYQDQVVWFEIRIRGAYGRWVPITDDDGIVITEDSREAAQGRGEREVRADIPFRVVRRRGIVE